MKLVDYGFVYLLKKSGWFESEHKIGITRKTVDQRRDSIVRSRNRRLKKKWYQRKKKQEEIKMNIVWFVPVFFPERVEKHLHSKYEKYERKAKRKFSGSTELFTFSVIQRLDVVMQMLIISLIQHIGAFLIGFFFVVSLMKFYGI